MTNKTASQEQDNLTAVTKDRTKLHATLRGDIDENNGRNLRRICRGNTNTGKFSATQELGVAGETESR